MRFCYKRVVILYAVQGLISGTVFIFLMAFFSAASAQHTGPAPSWNVKEVMLQLKVQGYWIDTSVSPLTSANRQAIISFQKVHKLKRTGKLSEQLVKEIVHAKRPLATDSLHRFHVEVDLNRQVLFVVDSVDYVQRIVPVSTGNGKKFLYPDKGWEYARTPRGFFKVYYKIKGWRKSDLGMLFDPLYIYGGFAIHGSESVPAYPASHGCIRIPLYASDALYRSIPIGTPVIVFGNNPMVQ